MHTVSTQNGIHERATSHADIHVRINIEQSLSASPIPLTVTSHCSIGLQKRGLNLAGKVTDFDFDFDSAQHQQCS